MAERVIVIVRGRLAAAGGHRAIRDAMDDVPRQVLVRAQGGRRLAAALLGSDVVAGVHRRRRRHRHLVHPGQGAGRAPPPGRPRPRCAPHRGPPPRRLARGPLPRARAMTATTASRARPVLPALVGYTLRSCLPGRRWVGALIPAAASLLFGAHRLDHRRHGRAAPSRPWRRNALFGLVMPVTCLVIGDAVLGAEVRSGRSASRGCPPSRPGRSPWAAGWAASLAAAGTLAVAFALAAVVAGAPEVADAVAIAAAFGAQAYVAVFLAIGCITKRAAVWSLAFVFLVERLLGAGAGGHRPAQPDLGGTGRLRRPQPTRGTTSSARASPTATRPSSA